MTPSAAGAAAAMARPWSLSAVAAVKTVEEKVRSSLFLAAASNKEAIAGSAMLRPSEETGQAAAENESLSGSFCCSSSSFSATAAARERQRCNKVFPFGARRLESAANHQVMLPGCTVERWPPVMRCPQKAEVAGQHLRLAAFDSRNMHHSESVSFAGEGSCSPNSSRSRYSNRRCNNSSRDNMKWSCSNNSVSIVEKEQETSGHSSSNAARRCSSVRTGSNTKTLCRPAEWSNSHGAQKRIVAGDERDACSTVSNNSRNSRQKTDYSDAQSSNGTNSSSSGYRSYSTTSIWKDQTKREKRKNDTSMRSMQTGSDYNIAATSASCVFKGNSSLSPCPQPSVLQRFADAFPNGAVSAVSSGSPVDPCFEVGSAAAPKLVTPSRVGDAPSTVDVFPSAAVVTLGATAVPSAGIGYFFLPSSWLLFILTPLAAFLAAAFEAQHRQRVAACEASSPRASSTTGATRNSSISGPSSSPSASSIFRMWPPSRLLRVEGAAYAQAEAAVQQQLPGQQAELKQKQEEQQHHPRQQLRSLSSGERGSSLPGSRLFFSSAAVAGQSSTSGAAGNNLEGVGGSGLSWTDGAVGSCAEAANAPLEDRSLAVMLPLDVSSEALFPGSNSSRMPSQTGKVGELEVVEELLARAALVFPEEIRRRQQKDQSWRMLRLPSPTAEATSLSLSGLCPLLAAARSEYGGSDAFKKGGDGRETKETGMLLGDSSNICLLAAVIDGHGGPQVAEYVQQNLPRHVHRELRRAILASEELPSSGSSSEARLSDNVLGTAMTQAFRALDDEIFSSVRAAYALSLTRGIRVGACCTAILLLGDKLLVANSGDCKAILSRGGGKEVIELNVQLNANSPVERQRLRKEHPGEDNVVVCKHSWEEQRKPSSPVELPLYYAGLLGKTTQYSACYVKGRLQPTRAFGDFLLKRPEYAHELRQRSSRRTGSSKGNAEPQSQLTYPYLTVDPVVSIRELRGDEDFIVLGSDGVWDFLCDADVNCTVHASLRRNKEQGILSQTAPQAASLEPSHSTEPKRKTAVDAVEAARTAAADIVRTVLQKAADAQNMTTDEMKACDPKRRRHYYDDTTAVVVLLGNVKNTGDLAARSKL